MAGSSQCSLGHAFGDDFFEAAAFENDGFFRPADNRATDCVGILFVFREPARALIGMRYPAMAPPIHHMEAIRYYRDGRHWDLVAVVERC